MKTISREFNLSSSDFESMWKLLKEDYNERESEFSWLFSRLEYWRYGIWHDKKYVPTFWSKNAQLWFNSFGELLGFVVNEEGDEMFTIVVKKNYEYLYDEILKWVMDNWSHRGNLMTEISSHENWKGSILESNKFYKKKQTCTTRMYDLNSMNIEERISEDNYKILDMSNSNDYFDKLKLRRNAFRNCEATEFDVLVNEYFIKAPSYNPSLDLSVVNEDGKHVSACIGWADYDNSIAEIETVCTHSDYRRKGLAELVIKDCFRRLNLLGIKYAYITGWNDTTNGLYEKLGPVDKFEWYLYEINDGSLG